MLKINSDQTKTRERQNLIAGVLDVWANNGIIIQKRNLLFCPTLCMWIRLWNTKGHMGLLIVSGVERSHMEGKANLYWWWALCPPEAGRSDSTRRRSLVPPFCFLELEDPRCWRRGSDFWVMRRAGEQEFACWKAPNGDWTLRVSTTILSILSHSACLKWAWNKEEHAVLVKKTLTN